MRATKQRWWTWLRPIRVFLGILIIFDFLGLLIGVLQLFGGGYVIGTVSFGDLSRGHPNLTTTDLSFGGVQFFWHPTGAYQILMFGLSQGLGWTVATLPMLIYGYHVTDVAVREDPFTLAMVRKLRKLGLLILVGGLVSEAAAFAGGWALLNDALANEPALRAGANLDLRQYPSFWWLLPGLLVLAFGEMVRRGCYLRAELDEVI